jgi:hypothetical protein
MIYANNPALQELLKLGAADSRLQEANSFEFSDVAFDVAVADVSNQHGYFNEEETRTRAAYRLLTRKRSVPPVVGELPAPIVTPPFWRQERVWRWLQIAWAIAILAALILIAAHPAHAQSFRDPHYRLFSQPAAPDSLIVQFKNAGSLLATRPAGLIVFDCGANMSCSFSGSTFSLTAGAGGAVAWSGISAPTANLSLAHAAWTTTFTWNAATGAGVDLFNLADTLNNTGTGHLFKVNLASGSAMKPVQFSVNGNGVEMSNAGLLAGLGTGGINATQYKGGTAAGVGTCTNQAVTATVDAAAPTCTTITSAYTSGTFPATAHNLLSASHTDTTVTSAVRGSIIYANLTPAWTALGVQTANKYPKWDGTDLVASTGAASGVGTPTVCTNQAVTGFTLNADAAPTSTCTTFTLASAQFANQGTTTTLLHGNGAGNPSWAAASLTADVSGILPTANGGTGIAFFTAAGPTVARVYTFPDAAATVLTSNAAVTIAQGGTGTGSTLTGLVRGSASAMTAAELSGDVTTNGSNAVTLVSTVLKDSSTHTLTNKTLDVEGTGNSVTTVSKIWLEAAACQNATATLMWDTPPSNPAVAACITGTNTQKGVADFADGANSLSMQRTLALPSDFTGAVDVKFKWLTTATTGDVVWQIATICVADAETDDPAFNTASTVTDTAKGTANQTNDASVTGITMTGCAAGEAWHIKVLRDPAHASDTLAATARLLGVELTVRRAQ